jgi:hypothetical protein
MQNPLKLSKSSDERLQQDIPLGACNKKGTPIFIIRHSTRRRDRAEVFPLTFGGAGYLYVSRRWKTIFALLPKCTQCDRIVSNETP